MKTNLLIFALLGSLLGILPTQAASPTPPIQDVRVLSDEWIAVVLDRTAEVIHARDIHFGEELRAAKPKKDTPLNWQYEFSKQDTTLATLGELRPQWVKEMEDPTAWKINGQSPRRVSWWPQTIGGFPAWDANWPAPAEYAGAVPRVADFVYLHLSEPLSNGATYAVEFAGGGRTQLVFDVAATPCWSIKVNQVGYCLDASHKFAYLGMWLGAAGAADFARFAGQPFEIRAWGAETAIGKALFHGTVRLRMKAVDQLHRKSPITGEDVYEMDFGDFRTPGQYVLVIPGLGRSWPFRIGEDVYGPAFYTTMKALYIQRCGIDLQEPFTAWTRSACHTTTHRGGFLPETGNWYDNPKYNGPLEKGTAHYGFRDEDGQPVNLSSFTMVGSTLSTDIVAGVKGGWHDAADYDRRVHHYNIVWNLCGAYEMAPAKFTDGQLNIPESGNGIPDILDEAAVQVDLFRKTQAADGGVSSWVEQNSHPAHMGTPAEDTNPTSTSLPDRMGSFQYAAAAAYLGRLIAPFAAARAKDYLESARKAYAWAADPAHVIHGVQFTVAAGSRDHNLIGKKVFFDEKPDLPGVNGGTVYLARVLADVQLWAATKEDRYRADWTQTQGAGALVRALPDGLSPSMFITLIGLKEFATATEMQQMQQAFLATCDQFLEGQAALAYRNLWWPPTHGYYTFMGWGGVHSARRALYPIVAWHWTGAAKYREAGLLGCDWELGCNEIGRALQTGVGTQHPVTLQHLHSERDSLLEPVPGIAPFTFAYGCPIDTWSFQLGLVSLGHPSVAKFFPGLGVCLLPVELGRAAVQAKMDALTGPARNERALYLLIQEAVADQIPIMRRIYSHPFSTPPLNEFTVYESIGPVAAAYAAFLPDHWQPNEALKTRHPITDPKQLPLYPQP